MRRLLGGGSKGRRAKVGDVQPGGSSSGGSSSGARSGKSADSREEVSAALGLLGGRARNASEETARAKKQAEAVVSKFVEGIRRDANPDERLAAAMQLAEFVNHAFGVDASSLGAHLRRSKGLAFVLQLLYEGDAPLQRIGLMVLSNLVSDAFDPRSGDTKKQVHSAGVFERLKDFVYSADGVAQTYACACLQNLCKDIHFAKLLRSYELVEELERLVKVSPNEHLRKFAAGALFNCVEAIHREFIARCVGARAPSSPRDGRAPPPP
jgi:hypothetical protein